MPYGSVDPFAVALWCLLLAIALAFYRPSGLASAHLLIVGSILLIFIAIISTILLQTASPPILGTFDPLWSQIGDLLGGPINRSVIVTLSAPFYSLGSAFACFLSLLLGLLLGADRRLAHRILMVFAWSGAAYASYGIISAITEPTLILGSERENYVGNVIGTFTYRNTAATYFGSCSVVWLLTLFGSVKTYSQRQRLTWKRGLRRILAKPPLEIILGFSGFFICLTALLMTTSRAGTLISLIALVMAGTVYLRRDLAKNSWLYAVLGCLLVLIVILQLFAGTLNQRFEANGFSDVIRLETYKSTLKMIADHPWIGVGLGNFEWAFPHYRVAHPTMFGVMRIAHSTPLEFMAEMGIPLTILVGVAWLFAVAILIRGIVIRRRDARIPLTAAAIAFIASVHSCIDFPLQISGYSIVAMAVIGAGLGQSSPSGPGDAAADTSNERVEA